VETQVIDLAGPSEVLEDSQPEVAESIPAAEVSEDRLLSEILNIVPDVLPSYALELFSTAENLSLPRLSDRVEAVVEALFSSTTPYPRIPKTNNKRKREESQPDDDTSDDGPWLDIGKRKIPEGAYKKDTYDCLPRRTRSIRLFLS
jgi:hypothetical protein